MFESILTTTSTSMSVMDITICLSAALLCGLIIAILYKMTTSTTRSFMTAICILPAIVMSVIMLVNGNLGIGVAVAGSFSLVRFRSLPGKANDIAVIFLAMACGLAAGVGYIYFALVMALSISLVNAALNRQCH